MKAYFLHCYIIIIEDVYGIDNLGWIGGWRIWARWRGYILLSIVDLLEYACFLGMSPKSD